MLSKSIIKYVKTLSLVAALIAFSANACDRHFGGGFGSFASYHPMLQQQKDAPALENISLIHTKSSVVAANKESNLSVTYYVPTPFKSVNVKVQSSEHIEILQNESVDILKKSGLLRVKYKALKKGTHSISLKVTSLKGGNEQAFTQSVNVVAT